MISRILKLSLMGLLEKPMQETEVVVIGGGPAGISAAIWLHQLGVPVLLLESSDQLGGLQKISPYMNDWIPGVQGKRGQDVALALHEHTLSLGVTVAFNSAVTDIECVEDYLIIFLANGEKIRTRFAIIATGNIPRSGGFIESDSVGIGPGDSIERIPVEGKRVAILGGGDNAFDQAFFALQRGARGIKIFARGKPRAQPLLQARIAQSSVQVGSFVADQNAMTVGHEKFDVISVQFGFEAAFFPKLPLQRLDGYISVDQSGKTNIDSIYACGDVTNFWHPCVATASAHGIQVAKTIATILLKQN